MTAPTASSVAYVFTWFTCFVLQDEYRVYIAHDGSMVADGLTTGEYNISAWNAGVKENAVRP